METNWKEIWNRRHAEDEALSGDWPSVFLELKRLNGYDVMEGGVPLNSWLTLHAEMKKRLRISDHASVFEVGCGAGANLYLFARDGLTVGGTDYAAALVDTARSVLPDAAELYCGEADSFPTEPHIPQPYQTVSSPTLPMRNTPRAYSNECSQRVRT